MENMGNNRILPGIKAVHLAPAGTVTWQKSYTKENTYTVAGDFDEMAIAGLCSFSMSANIVKGVVVYTYLVEGVLFDQDDDTAKWNGIPVCAKIYDVYNTAYILGDTDKPHATCSIGLSIDNIVSGKRYRPISISFVSTNMLKIFA